MTGARTRPNTDFEPKTRFVTLRFRSKDDYDPKDVIRRGIYEEEYVTVLCMPILEMTTTTPAELAGELLEYVLGAGKTRHAQEGDVLYIGEDPWVFITPKTKKLFDGAQIHNVVAAKVSTDLMIVRMEDGDAAEN